MPDDNINQNEELEAEQKAPQEEQQPVEEKSFDQVVEDARRDLYKSYQTSRRISNIVMISVVAAICGAMFLIIQQNNVMRIIGYSLAGALVVGMILYYVFTHKNFPNKTKAYVALVSKTINDEMFKNKAFSEIKSDPEEKLKMDDLVGDGIYAEANGINSRNVVRGVYRGHHFLYAEAALTRPSSRKQQNPPIFVGRYFSIPNDMKFDNRFVVVVKNLKEPLDLPNAVSDLVVLEEKEDFMVYGPEGANYRDVLDNKVISKIRKVKVEGHLLNMNIVFWAGHTAVYLSYDDAIMSVPFEKPFDKEGFEQSFADLLTIFSAITEE